MRKKFANQRISSVFIALCFEQTSSSRYTSTASGDPCGFSLSNLRYFLFAPRGDLIARKLTKNVVDKGLHMCYNCHVRNFVNKIPKAERLCGLGPLCQLTYISIGKSFPKQDNTTADSDIGQGHTDSRVKCRKPQKRLATSVALLIELKAQIL